MNERNADVSKTLTEQWKAGELKEFYGKPFYIKKQNGVVKVDYLCQYGFVNNYDVVEVIAPCDYNDLVYLHKAKNDAHEIVESLTQENTKLKEQINHLLKTQARQFVDNQKLQVKAEKAKDVVNIDTARQIKQLKELLKECREILYAEEMIGGNPRYIDEVRALIKRINKVLGEE